MSRNNSHARKLERKHVAYWNFNSRTSRPLTLTVRLIAERPGNSRKELTRLLGRDMSVPSDFERAGIINWNKRSV